MEDEKIIDSYIIILTMLSHEILFNHQYPLDSQLDDLTPEQTFTIPRADLLQQEDDSSKDDQMRSLILFLKYLAIHPSIEGVALSKIESGNTMADFFVRIIEDKEMMPISEIMRGPYSFLGAATGGGIRSIRSAVVQLLDTTFEQTEQAFRGYYDQTYDYASEAAPFNLLTQRSQEMELISIIRFT